MRETQALPLRTGRAFRLLLLAVALCSLAFGTTACVPGSAFWSGFWEGYSGVSAPTASGTIQGTISSSFSGLGHGNLYVLTNGQVWEQTEFYIWYRYAYYPRVTISSSYGAFKMKVEGIDHAVTVRRLR